MKAIFIAFLLLASMAFLPSSTLAARELVAVKGEKAAVYVVDPNNPKGPAIKCPPNTPYERCLNPPAPKCNKVYSRGCK
ncbi:hypothetical protein HN51_006471 [Arachis hypogaea]